MDNHTALVAVAQAEDTYDLLNHIAWTDVLKPKFQKTRDQLSQMLVNHLLGNPLQEGLTKEQVAGQIYGLNYAISTIESVLTRGEKALEALNNKGISLK